MASTLKPFDPDLGRKFIEENGGLVFVRGKRFQIRSEEQMPLGLDAQQQHDWLVAHPGAKDPTVDE